MTATYTDFALVLLEDVLGPRDRAAEREAEDALRLKGLGFIVAEDTPAIATKGCPKCKGTMYRTEDKDGKQYVCSKCGHVQ